MDAAAWLERLQRKRRDIEQTVGRKRPQLEPFAEKVPTSKGTQHSEDIVRESTVALLTAEACNRKWNVFCLAVPKSTLRKLDCVLSDLSSLPYLFGLSSRSKRL